VGRQGGRWEREMGNGRGGVEEGECVGRAGGEGVGWGGVKWEMGNGRGVWRLFQKIKGFFGGAWWLGIFLGVQNTMYEICRYRL